MQDDDEKLNEEKLNEETKLKNGAESVEGQNLKQSENNRYPIQGEHSPAPKLDSPYYQQALENTGTQQEVDDEPLDRLNEGFGPYYDDEGNQIPFRKWFWGGKQIVKKKSYFNLPYVKHTSILTSLTLTVAMIYATFFIPSHTRIHLSYTDLEFPLEAALRSLGSLLVHADLGHLGSNLLLLLPFSFAVMSHFRYTVYPVGFFIAGGIVNYLTVWIQLELGRKISLVGCSGLVYALVSFWIVTYVLFEKKYSAPEKILRGLGVAIMLLFPTEFSPKTSYLAHGVGFFVGIIFAGLIWLTEKDRKEPSDTTYH